MSIEQALLTHAEALNNLAAALRESGGVQLPVAGASASAAVQQAVEQPKEKAHKEEAAEAAPAEKKRTRKSAAEKPAAEEKAEAKTKTAEITDEEVTAVFGPLLAKSLDADQLASNKKFVASINEHFGVARLRDLSQEQRAEAIAWGKARAEDPDFEIAGSEADEDDGI